MSESAKKVAIYCRAGSDVHAMTFQTQRVTEFVKANEEWRLTKIYCDQAVTGMAINRSALKKMLHAAESGEFNALAVLSFSRLARTHDAFEVIRKKLDVNGIEIVSATGEALFPFALDADRG